MFWWKLSFSIRVPVGFFRNFSKKIMRAHFLVISSYFLFRSSSRKSTLSFSLMICLYGMHPEEIRSTVLRLLKFRSNATCVFKNHTYGLFRSLFFYIRLESMVFFKHLKPSLKLSDIFTKCSDWRDVQSVWNYQGWSHLLKETTPHWCSYKKMLWKYAANFKESSHVKVWFQWYC